MVESIYPPVLQAGDKIQVVAPSLSLAMISDELVIGANEALESLGLESDASDAVYEVNQYGSSACESRVADLHAAFTDQTVAGIMAVVGGTNCNEILPFLDYDLIVQNPKVLCGFSDITALQNAIYAKTGLVSFSGPHWSTFAMRDYNQQTLDWFCKVVMEEKDAVIRPVDWFTDDDWYQNQDQRRVYETDGWWVLQEGVAQGIAVGGNLSTFNLLKGTEFMPDLNEKILFVECEAPLDYGTMRRDLHALMQVPGAQEIRALVIGRCQRQSRITKEGIIDLVSSLGLVSSTPVLANVDFGHTNPMMTFPVGGQVSVHAERTDPHLVIHR